MKHLTDDDFWTAFTDLLAGRGQDADDDLPGAELAVFHDGREVFRAALARHARRDHGDPDVVWLRPLVAPATGEGRLPNFDAAVVRRRALYIATARLDGRGLALELHTGQTARIEPARADRLAVLQDFDTWIITLAGEQRAELEALEDD
jgi:hypothetical protein